MADTPIYGLLAEFDDPGSLIKAAERTYQSGYRQMDTFSPYPVEGAWEAMEAHDHRLSKIVLGGGILGGCTGYGLEYWVHAITYPTNIAGKPLNSWPQFIPVTFETTVLGAALTAFIGMWALNKLPQPYHPVFNAPRFQLASQDRFFLLIEAKDPKFEMGRTRAFLESLKAREVVAIDE